MQRNSLDSFSSTFGGETGIEAIQKVTSGNAEFRYIIGIRRLSQSSNSLLFSQFEQGRNRVTMASILINMSFVQFYSFSNDILFANVYSCGNI